MGTIGQQAAQRQALAEPPEDRGPEDGGGAGQ
jgi:hypothetical protein